MVAEYQHSLRFEVDKCEGCMSCMRACPTEAVRVRMGRAVKVADRCIDCGECIRVCHRGAIVPLTDCLVDLSEFDCKVAIPSPVLYAQFRADISPGTVLGALKQYGFDDVECLSSACEAVAAATDIFLREYCGRYPLISSFCPTIVRLVQVKYPDLVDSLLPIIAPREIAARDAKARISKEKGLPEERIGAVYITPCPARRVAILEHPGMRQSHLDAAVSISDVFQPLAAAFSIVSKTDANISVRETLSGMNWAFNATTPGSLCAEDTISVAGLPNVIRILDDVEKERLGEYRYIECRACPEGCVGGCLTVENPYVARAKAIKLGWSLPAESTIDQREVEARYRKGDFHMDEKITSRPLVHLDRNIGKAIAKMTKRDRILSRLPKIDCGVCGAPSCQAFAEDVVLAEADQKSCVFLWELDIANRIEEIGGLIRAHLQATGERQ